MKIFMRFFFMSREDIQELLFLLKIKHATSIFKGLLSVFWTMDEIWVAVAHLVEQFSLNTRVGGMTSSSSRLCRGVREQETETETTISLRGSVKSIIMTTVCAMWERMLLVTNPRGITQYSDSFYLAYCFGFTARNLLFSLPSSYQHDFQLR